MKVLIIGAQGNLGSQLMKVFSVGYEVIAWDRDDIDVTEKTQVFKKITDLKPGIIINCASYNAVDNCETKEGFEIAKKVNGEAVGYLADLAIEIGATLVHYSTDYVFAGDKKEGYAEVDVPAPISKYGESKLLGEKEILARIDQGLKYYLIRPSKLFGPKGDSEIAKPSFFDIMLKLAEEKDSLDVVDEEVSCFTYTPDLALATKVLVSEEKEYGIYHLVNEGAVTWYESAVELFKIADINIKVNPVTSDKFPRPAKRPKYSPLVNTKFIKLRNYKEALEEYLRV